MLDRFELEGITYYQQGRKCGKPGCACANGGPPHGPYWYSRNQTTGKRAYIGKELPDDVAAARSAHDRLLTAMVQERRELIRQADALARLISNRSLRDGDHDIISSLGFRAALVSQTFEAGAQDG